MIKERVQRLMESLIIGYQRAISPRFPPMLPLPAYLLRLRP
ncbi:MAG: hypothetical protein ACLTV1_13015 [Christensenellales bacterium]